MNKSPLLVALLAILVSGSAAVPLAACDRCATRAQCRDCAPVDNRGLLDVLDTAAGRIHSRLPKMTMPSWSLPKLFACDSGPICGCEGQASCGCELKPARSAVREPSCGCELRAVASNSSSRSYGASPSPFSRRDAGPAAQPHYPAPHAPQSPSSDGYFTPRAVPQPGSQPDYRRVPSPGSQSIPGAVPLPDNQVDPFKDDTAGRIRRIPTRTIQYREQARDYSTQYDPQAQHRARRRVSDDARPAEEVAEPVTVVTASGREPQQLPANATGQQQSSPTPAFDYYANPLRN